MQRRGASRGSRYCGSRFRCFWVYIAASDGVARCTRVLWLTAVCVLLCCGNRVAEGAGLARGAERVAASWPHLCAEHGHTRGRRCTSTRARLHVRTCGLCACACRGTRMQLQAHPCALQAAAAVTTRIRKALKASAARLSWHSARCGCDSTPRARTKTTRSRSRSLSKQLSLPSTKDTRCRHSSSSSEGMKLRQVGMRAGIMQTRIAWCRRFRGA
jgi:hypothetical protein